MCTQIQRYQNIYLSILTTILIYQNQHKHMLYVKQIPIILFDFWYNRVLTVICMVLWKSCAKHMRINKIKLNIKRNNVYLSNYKLFKKYWTQEKNLDNFSFYQYLKCTFITFVRFCSSPINISMSQVCFSKYVLRCV